MSNTTLKQILQTMVDAYDADDGFAIDAAVEQIRKALKQPIGITDSDRLDLLLDNEAYVVERYGTFKVYQRNLYSDDVELTRGGPYLPREAIDSVLTTMKG